MPYKDKAKAKEAKQKWEKEHRGKGKRHRVWTCIFYPNTADPDWREIAEELGLPFLVSPLHDKDTWTAHDERKNPKHKAGENKEDHFHGIAEYPQPVDYETFKADFEFLGTHNIKYVKSKASMSRYLVHMDCKDKAQYDPSEVLEFGGANWHDWCSELEDVHAILKDMRDFIREHNVTELDLFWDWCDDNNDTWSRALDLKCAWAIGQYIERRRNRLQQSQAVAATRRIPNDYPEPEPAEQEPDYSDFEPDFVDSEADFIESERQKDQQHECSDVVFPGFPDPFQEHGNPFQEHGNPFQEHGKKCLNCGGGNIIRKGKTPAGTQRFKCKDCGAMFV